MAKDVLQSEHSCVAVVSGLSWLTGVTSTGGEDGIIIAGSRVLSIEESRERKSFFLLICEDLDKFISI